MKKLLLFCAFLLTSFNLLSQSTSINLPDIPGYVTLKCDFHMHTTFSDGSVWPTSRVDEALRDGLDAIAITDHIEYTPKKDFVPNDFNAAWKLCEQYAKERNLILVHGAEITRKMPPGHMNALFIKDASALAVDSAWDAFETAAKQGAFLMWNHPGWKSQQPDGIPRMYEIHKRLIQKGYLQGIEFFNDSEYYPLVFRFCEENNLALMGNSDVHGVISEIYADKENIHRPMTLVFAKERTHESLREAMFAHRTMVFFRDILAGREELARPFFNACITVGKPYYENDKNIFIEITNKSDIPFYLINGKTNTPSSITLAPNAATRVVISKKASSPLVYDVRNIMTGENKVLRVELRY